MKISFHSADDWCHLCGSRKYPTVDIWYYVNAEHPSKNRDQYIRICKFCAVRIAAIAGRGVAAQKQKAFWKKKYGWKWDFIRIRVEQGRTPAEISQELGVTRQRIYVLMRKQGISPSSLRKMKQGKG